MPFVYYVMGMILKVENQVVLPPGPTLSIPRSLVWALDLSPALLGLFSKTQAHPHLQPFSKPMLKMLDVFRALAKCKMGAKCQQKKYPKFLPKIEEISTIFFKKIASNWRKLGIFRFISLIFCPFFENIGALHLLLIWWLLASPRWSDGPDLVRAPTVNFMCIWWSKLKLAVIQQP